MGEANNSTKQQFIDMVRQLPKVELYQNFQVDGYLDPLYKPLSSDRMNLNYELYGQSIGWGMVLIHPVDKELSWSKFYPNSNFDELKRNGIGTIATFESIIFVIKNYPEIDNTWRICYGQAVSEERQAHLRRLGISLSDGESITLYLSKLAAYLKATRAIPDDSYTHLGKIPLDQAIA